jgi:hypothetical protein
MASQDPSTAYTAAPEKKSGSWFPSFSLPKLPDFFGTGASAAPAPAPSAPVTAVAEQSSVQPGGRRRRSRKMTKKAGRRRRHIRRGGDEYDPQKPDITFVPATPVSFPPTQVRKGKGRRRHTRRGGVETPMQKIKYGPKEYKFLTDGYKLDFSPTQVRRPKVESPPPVQAPNPTGKGRRTRRVKKHSRR